MTETDTETPRERYRAQVRAEIKQHAWEQLATAGASALSLNAIAKRMGVSGPALYRYFASRDALITELIRDAYRSLADAFQATTATATATAAAAATADGGDLIALAHTLRRWALDDPQRYFLIYGTPVPGYHAPDDITAIASENMTTLLTACAALPTSTSTPPSSAATYHRALTFWTRLHGVLSLELAGHFTGMGFDVAEFYAAELDALLATG